jgi:hypothetical protein
MDFVKVVGAIAEYLEREGARFALAGAFALHAYGLSRATTDLDFVMESDVRARFVAFMEQQGYVTTHESEGYSTHVHPEPEKGRVDVVYVSGETARLMFESARASLRFGERDIPVPKPEHLSAMKIQAMLNDPGRSWQEMADIRFLLLLPAVDREEIRGYFEKAGLGEKFDEIRRSLPDA